MPRTITTTGEVCTIVAAVVVAAADDSLTDDQIGTAALADCAPAAAAGQCTVADVEAMIDGDDSTEMSGACEFAPTQLPLPIF